MFQFFSYGSVRKIAMFPMVVVFLLIYTMAVFECFDLKNSEPCGHMDIP
jgi:hypothetical protein